jgi:RimJ/RimL family protein N-acetyltransferase
VLLRPPTLEDVDAITEACRDPEISAWVTVPVPYGREHAEGFITGVVDPGWKSGTELTWAIRDVTDGRLLGMIGLHDVAHRSADIGYWVAPWARRQGYLRRALDLVLDHAFDPDGLDLLRVGWEAYVGNWPSRRAAWRAGFRVEGTVRLHAVQREGLRRDAWLGTLLRDDPREPTEPWPDAQA